MAHLENFPPVQSAAYQYHPSRNPYWERICAATTTGARIFTDHATETWRGRWREQFNTPNDGKVIVELGCNGGHVTLGSAERSPLDLHIGLDTKFKQVFFAHEKSLRRKISNTVFLRARAERLGFIFAPGEIDVLRLYFPDPWPKKAHAKHRYIRSEWLSEMASLVKVGGIFHLKTDHDGYFETILEAMSQCQGVWKITEETWDLHQKNPDPQALEIPDVTLFERIFIRDGIKIKSFYATRI